MGGRFAQHRPSPIEQELCRLLLASEARFLGRLYRHSQLYQESSPILMLTAAPFLSILEYGAAPYASHVLRAEIRPVGDRTAEVRHRTKVLADTKTDYARYAVQANAVRDESRSHFESNAGPLRRLLQPDVGVFYHQGMPVCSSYTYMRLMTGDDSALFYDEGQSETFHKGFGFELGQLGASLYASQASLEEAFLLASISDLEEFEVTANDYRYKTLVKPFLSLGTNDHAAFFLLSELMFQLWSVDAFSQRGLIDGLLWVKLAVVTLDTTWKSLVAFESQAHGPRSEAYSERLLGEIGTLLTREERKTIKRAHRVRNAMVHYDFGESNVPDSSGCGNVQDLLESAIVGNVDMPLKDYVTFLSESCERIAGRISDLLSFPNANMRRDKIQRSVQPNWPHSAC